MPKVALCWETCSAVVYIMTYPASFHGIKFTSKFMNFLVNDLWRVYTSRRFLRGAILNDCTISRDRASFGLFYRDRKFIETFMRHWPIFSFSFHFSETIQTCGKRWIPVTKKILLFKVKVKLIKFNQIFENIHKLCNILCYLV